MAEEVKPPRLAQGREHVVATVDEIPSGTHKLVPIGRHGVGVYNVNGTFYAIANYCPHEGGPLCSGRARGRTIVDESVPGDAVMVRDLEFIYCPWHQWGFELATGTTSVKPEWSIRTYPVRVVGKDVLTIAHDRLCWEWDFLKEAARDYKPFLHWRSELRQAVGGPSKA